MFKIFQCMYCTCVVTLKVGNVTIKFFAILEITKKKENLEIKIVWILKFVQLGKAFKFVLFFTFVKLLVFELI